MKDLIRQRKLQRPLIALIILLLAATSYRLWFAEPVSASGEVDQVWRNVQNSDSYAFTASVENKTIPMPTVGNIGRFSKTDTLYLEGENNLRDEELLLALWGGGVNVLDQSSAYQLRLADGKVETRIGDEAWQAGNELNVGFAPGGDFLAFLDVATDIQVVAESDTEATPDASYTIYQFNVDGPAYAQRLTRISQEHLVETNQLPAGVALQVPEHLQNLTGNGELWVDTRGLPVREIVTLNIPAAANTDYRTEATLDVQFNSYEGVSLAAIWSQPGRVISNIFARLPLPSLPEFGFSLTALLGVSLFMVIIMRPNRRTQKVVFSAMVALMLFTPLAQAQAASEQSEQLVTFKAEQEEIAAAPNTDLTTLTNTQPTLYTPPATPNQQPSTLDTDEDGLTDSAEELLGTNRLQPDSDFDGVTDLNEITGFTLGGQTWYGNPTVADSNNDSVLDGLEWNVDTDGDNTPDLYDFDDDGDGVPDKVDISRLVASKADNGTAVTFTAANPLQLTLTGLNPGSYTYVDLQLRPTNPDRLWYAFNVLNWPKDELGNMQDWDNATFFDHCMKTGGTNCTMSPDDNGDIKFVPMLEVALSDLSNLPRTSGNALDEALLEKYGIAIQPAGDGSYFAYVPLNLVEDPITGAKVAFQAKLIYQAGTNWTPQQARMVWVVNVLNEFYDDAKDARTTITAGNGVGENSFTVLHAYTDDFYLTGFNVHESRGTQMAIVYEDPAVDVALNDDDALFQMVNGLEGSLMVNRDCDFVNNEGECVGNGQRDITINEINRRWNHPTNTGITASQRWGIGDYLRVQTHTFAHEDQALFEAGGQIAPQILTTRFQGSGVQIPHLLYVREDHLRALNIDARNLSNLVQWTGHSLAVNFANEPVMATAGYKIVPYRYNTLQAAWEAYPMADYADHVRASFAATTDGLPQENNGPVVVEASAYYSTIMVVTMTNGSNTVINTDTNSNYTLTSTLQGAQQFFKPLDISDEKIYNAYNQAIQGVANRFIQQVRFNSENFVNIFDLVRLYSYVGFKVPPDNTGGGAYDLVLDNASVNYRLAFVSFNAALLLGGVAGLILMNTKGRVAGEIIVQATATVGQVLDTMITLSEISRAVELANPTDASFLIKVKTLFSFQSVSSMAFKAGAIGAIVGIGVSWIMFFSLLGKVPIGSVEFYNLLAGAIAATLVAIITFVISLTVVGAIVLAVFAIFDLFTLILCKAGVKAVCDFGLMAAITQAITDWVYQGEVMIDLSGKPPISNIEDLNMNLTNPEQGLVVGNSVRFEAEMFTRIRHTWPKPSVVYHYGSFYTREDLQSASVVYSLTTTKTTLNTERGRTTWLDAWPYDTATALVPSPGVGWLVALEKSKVLWEAARFDTILSPVYEFTTPQINREFPLWLNVGMALPRYDCWFSVCSHKTAKSPTSTNLTGKFVLDILPNSITAFYNWSALGVQNDFDGDGIPRLQDANDTRWDTDSDGVPDQVEIEYGSSPTLADKDGDGLNDALEVRYSTNPNRADTDGDGLSDAQEVNGYLVTIAGYTFRITSDPLQRDADKDGISDGTEYRLNQLDPVLFPFHPDVFNDSPVRLYTYMNDDDLVLAVSAQATITTTVFNGLPQNSLLAGGRFTSTLPLELGGLTQARNFTLLPSGSTSIVRNATAIAGSTNVTITTGVAADIVPVGTTPLPPFTDIILDNPVGVIIDNDNPDAPSLTLGNFVEPDVDVIIGGTASDPTSYVALVEVSVNGGAYITATGTSMWAFPVSVPNQPTGSIPIAVRVTDAVGHTRTGNFSLTIDGVAPVTTLDLSAGQTRVVRRNAEGEWTMALSGNSSDALAGIGEVSVQIGSSRAVTVTDPSGAWTLDYPFDDIAFNNDPNPTGPITMTVTTRDNALPTGNAVTQIVPFVVDMTPPTVDLLSHGDDFQLTDGIVLTGTVQDEYTAVSGVEIAFVSAETVFATAKTWLHLPLNDLPETVQFNNVGGEQTQIYCLDVTCPDSYVSGTDGTAAQFDGNDILRSFEDLTLPATERTIALWFNTTCANCGLFSSVQGDFPTLTEHDHDIFLDAGKVCVSFITGPATRELRCSVANSYNDGQWHQIVHTLGDNGNGLYLDGELAVSSPTTGSTFTTPDAVLVGYSPAAATPHFTGKLDDVVVYDGDMNATVATSLYRQWQPVTFIPDGSPLSATWAYTVPLGIEGYYQIDMRAADTIGNRSDSRGEWSQFRGPIDTKPPTFNVSVAYNGSGSAAQTLFTGAAYDANLTTTDYDFVCDLSTDQLRYATDPTELEFTQQENAKLTGIEATCTQNGFQSSQISMRACDAFGHCAAAIPPQTVAYIGTSQNQLKPAGSLPNGIERTVLSDPQNREMLIERPGQIITDIAIDEAHGKLYWAEMNSGAYNQPASIWRANLDGSNVEQIIGSLTAYAPEALQIALDPAGNKLYWTQGYQLWWANLDGTLPQVIYAVPDDPGLVGGNRDYHHIGDVAVDLLNGRLILSERRLRFDRPVPGVTIFNHSLIVTTQLNGTSPQFIAGVGAGCTYANFYQNVGSGIDPTLCVDQTGGMDVESVAVVNGTAYWTAVDPAWTGSAVYGQPFSGATFTVAPLELDSSYPGLRMNPLPHLYIPPTGTAVYVSLAETIVRGETGGVFSLFSSFRDETPAPVGTQARLSNQITALAVTQTEQAVQTEPDLAVTLTSPAVVMLDGDSSRYDVVVRNNSGLPADSTDLTLDLPSGATFTGSNGSCAAASTTVTCDLGRFPALDQQTISISFTISTSTLTQLSATATVASATADANPNDNSITSNSITAAPTLAALPGVPYIYYSTSSHLVRVPLIGDPVPEPIQFDNNGIGGPVFAIDNGRGYAFIVNDPSEVVRVNLDGTGFTVIGDANPGNVPTQDGTLSVAVDTASGRVYWTEVVTMVYTRIRSANNDGSDVQTIVPIVYGQKGLLFDPVRNLLYWVGLDSQQRQYVIYRSNPDGSNVQVVYTAAAGAQIRDLALDPYAQKLYWLDGVTDEGTLFRADSDGGNLAALDMYIGSDARGLVVLPAQNTLYYSKYGSLYQAELDGNGQAQLVWLGNQRYYGVSNLNPTVFPFIYINPPSSNLAYGLSTPYAPSPCVAADPNELNDTPATATTLTAGTYAAAICRSSSDPALGLDKDVYQIVVPAGQAITATLSSLPANYGMYIQNGDFTVDVSNESGTTDEQVLAANYEPTDAITYTLTIFPSVPVNNFDTYQLDIELGTAPPNGYTDAQCLAVDPNDLPGEDGNHTFANATPLTVGTGIQGALCYENDSDFFKFTATAGQVVALDLPTRPADYSILLYAPDGSFRQSFIAPNYAPQVTLDVAGEWRVLVRDNVLTPTNVPYQLLVTDLTCGQNDSYEPNNVAALAADLTGTSRVFASLCAAADLDFYTFQSGANQQLTLNYPANPANATITLLGANGELGRLDPGTQGKFDLSSAGWYTLTVANSGLSGSDALYMFQWQVAAPSAPNTGTPYVYYTDAFHFTRVALSADHIVEPLLVDAGALTWDTLATDTTRGWLYFYDLMANSIVRADLYGTNPQTIITDANPGGVVSLPHVAMAVDEASGRIYWLQPTGASASTASFIMRSNGDGTGTVQVVGNGLSRDSLVVDPIKGVLYWTENDTIRRSDLDGNGVTTLYTATSGNQVRDLALDPYSQKLYWLDPNQQTLFRANSDGTGITAIVTGLAAGARGVALQPLDNALYYSNGTAMMRAQLDGSGAAAIATLSGTYLGPSNLNPGTYLNTPIGTPGSSLAFGYNTPIVSPCALADIHEPNNDSGTATPLTVITQTVATGALCNTVIPNPTDMDYYHVTLADQKVLTATLTNLPADYRLVIIHPNGYAAAFSDNAGLTDELGVISNTSGAPVEYDILVMSGTPVQNYDPYQLTLTLGDVPPPPDPGDADCYYADPYDAPAPGGNGTIGTATDLTLDVPVAAALCYSNDVDMYGFAGLDGQRLTIDLPIRPDTYTLTLYDPSGTAWATPAYGSQVTLDASGRWTIAVSHVPLTPTTDQYQLLVTDESCVSSDAYEPNDSTGEATLLSNNSRVRASLCSDSDVDTYHIWAIAGQQLTLNYPTNSTGSTLAVSSLGTVNTGTQGQFAIASTGWVTVTVSNNTLSTRNVPYLFQATLGAPTPATADTPYVYYSNASDLTRVAVITRTIEPILMGNGTVGGSTIATDLTRGKLYILDNFERLVRVNFDGTGHEIIIPDADPNNILRFANGLAVDESSGRIYWMEPQFGVVTNLMSANGDGTDVQTLVTTIANERAIAIDPIAGWVYWVEHSLYNGDVIDQIRRANLDGSDVTVIYAAPPGREIHDLAIDPYHQKLYWLDPTLRQVMWADSDGSDVDSIAVSLTSPTRGLIVRPLNNELYYTSGLNLVQATLTGGNPTTLARLEGSYSGVSNLDPGVFYLTGFSTPSSNLALGLSAPYAQPCTDVYEPNNSAGTAAAISTGSISSVLCTSNASQPDTQDYYEVTVPDGQQVDVTLTDLPQDYGLGLLVNGTWVDSSYTPGLIDEAVAGVNESGAAADYTILVERFGGTTSSNVPYTLTVNIGVPTPPPPPPPPPGDPCPAVDAYDAYGALGNGSLANASPISFNTPITAALCYENDLDMYTFSGVIGQNVVVDLPVRPANYYVMVYKPDGSFFKMFHPAYSATYGDSITLSESGNWYVGVWQPTLPPTTDQYQLLLSVNTTCSGLDPYEPNNEQGSEYHFVGAPPATLSAMLCETSDFDYFTFDVAVGQRVRITPRVMTPGMEMFFQWPGSGFGSTQDPIDQIMRESGQFTLALHSPEPTENLPYEIDIQLDPVPTPTPLPNNWSCTTYSSSDIPQPIDDLTTVGSTVTVPISGTVTHVGIHDIIFDHGGLWNVSFGLGAPNGTLVDLFAFDATNQFYVWCGGSNCHMSLDDGAIPGLIPPQFPNDGGTFQPNLSSFAPFNGLSSLGTWTLYVSDNFAPEPGDEDAGDTTGDLFSWDLEICVDNGNPPDPTPTPSPTATPPPQPTSGTPTPPAATSTPAPTPTATATSCAVNADAYESDNTPGTATLFDMSSRTSGTHTFHTFSDKDWMSFSAVAGREYTFTANKIGTNEAVSLAIYRSNGTTLELIYEDEIHFTPTVSGDYYLVAGATTGIAMPCNASYNVALTVTNPDATPIPTPIGTPAPPDHDRPPVSSAIITPTNGTAVTTIAPVTVQVGLAADSGIGTAILQVNGTTLDSYTAPPSLLDTVWQPSWTPALTGVYTLTAYITDTNGMTATSPISVVYVDTADPTVSITTETITQALLREDGLYGLHGTASDDSRVRQVEVQINGGDWQEAVVSGNSWLLPIAPLAQANPNGGTLAITVHATDMAGRTATASDNLTLDVVPPDPFTITASLTSGVLISPTQITAGLDSRLTWPVISGTVNVYAGWTAIVTPTLGTLTMYGAAAGSHDQLQVEATARYGHVVAVDANGNQTALTSGPFYFDGPETPDLISSLGVSNWTDSGGKQVGQMNGTNYGTQQLFAGWNASHLRLRWNGVNVDGNGDLYFYLGTATGGSTDLFNPFGPDDPGVLPFAADYVIHVSSSLTATLYTAGSGWTAVGPVDITASGNSTDLLIPFASLGIATPASASLQLLGVASDESTLNVWATIPDKNLKQPSWTQYIQWGSLGSGLVPANGVWADAQIEAAVAAYPDPALKVGAGDTITLTLTYSNTGTASLPQLTLDGAGSGGFVVNNGPQTATNIPPGGSGTVTLLGTVNANGTVAVTLADSYHRPYALGTFDYTLDTTAPVSITIALDYVGSLTNTIKAMAEDESPLTTIEVEIDDGLPFGPTAVQIVTCVPGSGTANAFVCAWNAGMVTDGHSYTLRGRATDIHGNVSGWSSPVTVIGDATAPVLTIGTATQSALSDNRLGGHELVLDGTLVDERAAATTQVCLSETITVTTCLAASVLPAPDNTWSLALPGNYNGITGTLSIVGFDKAGNPSNPFTQTVWLDTISPVISTTVAPDYIQMIGGTVVTFTSGTTIDASGLMSATVVMLLPNGNSTIVNGTVNGNTWAVGYEFTLIGDYEAVLILTDGAGNRRYSPIWQFEVGSDPTVVRLLDLNVVNGQAHLPALVVVLLLLSGLTGLAFRFQWQMGMKRQK